MINRSPSGPLNFEVPEKVWTGKYVSYSHLRVYGCKSFVHVPKKERSKLDDKAIPHVFVGYSDELWDPAKKKLVRNRDVVFQDDQTLGDFDKVNQSKGTNNDFIELVPIPLRTEFFFYHFTPYFLFSFLSLNQPKNENEEIDELLRDDSANDIPVQELVEHEEQREQEDLIP